MSVLATRDELLVGASASQDSYDNMLVDKNLAELFSQGVFPPIFHEFRKRKIYVLRFFKEFKWRYVIIDDRLPCYIGNR
jgi:hypothetical protein